MSVWSTVPTAPPNKIFNLNTLYNNDTDTRKLNLGVGAYRSAEGSPYVFEVVRQAETALYEGLKKNELNKEYLPIRGDDKFARFAKELLYGVDSAALKEDRIGSVQSISGTGALRLAGEFLSKWGGKPPFTFLTPRGAIMRRYSRCRPNVQTYDYYDPSTLVTTTTLQRRCRSALKRSIAHVLPQSTGADLSQDEWVKLADFMELKKLIPMFDCA